MGFRHPVANRLLICVPKYRLPMQEDSRHSQDLYPLTVPPPYDGAPIYRTVAQYGADIEVIIPPRLGAVASTEMGPLKQRDRYVEMLQREGRIGWQKATGCGQRALV